MCSSNIDMTFVVGCGRCEMSCLENLGRTEKEGPAKKVLFFSCPSKTLTTSGHEGIKFGVDSDAPVDI